MEQKNDRQNRSRNGADRHSPRAAIYTRVNTSEQNPDLQLREVQDYAGRQGWEIVTTYQDVASGAKASRPGLNSLMADARARKFTCLLVWKLDRFGRSLVDCLNNIRFVEDHRIRFIAVTQGLDADVQNPASRFLLHVMGAAAEFERSLIRERTHRPAGCAISRITGLGKWGRPSGADLERICPSAARSVFSTEKG